MMHTSLAPQLPSSYNPVNDPELSGIGRIYDLWVPPSEEREALQRVARVFSENPLSADKAEYFVATALAQVRDAQEKVLTAHVSKVADWVRYIEHMWELAVLPLEYCNDRGFAQRSTEGQIAPAAHTLVGVLRRVRAAQCVEGVLASYTRLVEALQRQHSVGSDGIEQLKAPALPGGVPEGFPKE